MKKILLLISMLFTVNLSAKENYLCDTEIKYVIDFKLKENHMLTTTEACLKAAYILYDKKEYSRAAKIAEYLTNEKNYIETDLLGKRHNVVPNINAFILLAISYYKGNGVRQDKSKAKELFGKACDRGSDKGCKNYRILNEQGVK